MNPESLPAATLSLDLDNQWSYMKTHGDAGWEDYPTYLDVAVPRILSILKDLDLKITFFIVGKDAADLRNRDALQSMTEAGHEIANHSFWHEPWFHRYDRQQTEDEVIAAEEAIEEATGVVPRGWRGPGFSLSPVLLKILSERGYLYDASTFPTFIAPLARAFYLATSSLKGEEREKRDGLYGSWADGFRPLKPFRWSLGGDRELLELPVTTAPFVRTPLHASYLHYLSTYSAPVADAYFATTLRLCRLRGIAPSFLLHPTDFLGSEDVPELSYFPAMNRPRAWKEGRIHRILSLLQAQYEIAPMGRFAARQEGIHRIIDPALAGLPAQA